MEFLILKEGAICTGPCKCCFQLFLCLVILCPNYVHEPPGAGFPDGFFFFGFPYVDDTTQVPLLCLFLSFLPHLHEHCAPHTLWPRCVLVALRELQAGCCVLWSPLGAEATLVAIEETSIL